MPSVSSGSLFTPSRWNWDKRDRRPRWHTRSRDPERLQVYLDEVICPQGNEQCIQWRVEIRRVPCRADNFTKRAGEKKRARIPRDPRSTGDRRPDISQRLAMRSLLGINEAIISCHRSGIGVQQHPRALSPVLATNARGCATIYFPLRYTRHIARTVVQLALDEIGIARWHNARDTTSPAACSRVLHHHRHRRCCCLFHLLLLLFLLLLLLFPLLFNFSTSLFLLSGRFLPSLSRVFVVSFFFFYFISPLFFFFFFVPRARSFPERYRYTV